MELSGLNILIIVLVVYFLYLKWSDKRFDCSALDRFDYTKEVGCSNMASMCAAFPKAVLNLPDDGSREYCFKDELCNFDGTKWTYEEDGREYIYYPETRTCRDIQMGMV